MFVILRTSSLQKTSGTLLLSNQLLIFFPGSYKPYTHPYPTTLTHTHLQPVKKRSYSPTLTQSQQRNGHIHPHPASKRPHSPTTTHTQPRKCHTHPYPPTLSQKKVTLTSTQPKEGHTHPHITERKNVTCLTHHIYVKSIPFSQY